MSQHDTLGEFMDITKGISLDRLQEICDAERDNRCVVLPCKVSCLVSWMEEVEHLTGDDAENYTTGYRNGHNNGRASLIRFLLQISDGTCEAAEQALKEREQNV